MFLVRCPKCKQRMKVAPAGGNPSGKRKQCVYCGKSFLIHSLKTNRIIKRISP